MHFRQWKRRDFITLLGGAGAAAGHAGDRLPEHQASDTDAQFLVSFGQGLGERGLIEGQNAG